MRRCRCCWTRATSGPSSCSRGPSPRRAVLGRGAISVGGVVRWEDAPYAAAILDTVIAAGPPRPRRVRPLRAAADRRVPALARPQGRRASERIDSPLLLLPVTLTRKRGVRDRYVLQAESTEAEVNPALRQILRQLYGLELPESVDLAEERIEDLHARLVGRDRRDRARRGAAAPRAPARRGSSSGARSIDARRSSAGPGARAAAVGPRSYAYSYRRHDYRPLGIQIFRDRVAARPSPLRARAGRVRAPATAPATRGRDPRGSGRGTGVGEPVRVGARPDARSRVANVNSRTLSLVRDYGELLDVGRDLRRVRPDLRARARAARRATWWRTSRSTTATSSSPPTARRSRALGSRTLGRQPRHPGSARHRQVADDHQPRRRLRRARASASCSCARSARRSTSSTPAFASAASTSSRR